jgi:hypothetical protein
MTISYAWAVNQMTAYPEFAGQQNVVFQIAWVCSATDGTYNSAAYGTVDVTYVADSPYTPYEDITLEQANGWVAGALGEEGIAKAYADCDAAIADQSAQDKPVTPPLPWNVPTPAPEPVPELVPEE